MQFSIAEPLVNRDRFDRAVKLICSRKKRRTAVHSGVIQACEHFFFNDMDQASAARAGGCSPSAVSAWSRDIQMAAQEIVNHERIEAERNQEKANTMPHFTEEELEAVREIRAVAIAKKLSPVMLSRSCILTAALVMDDRNIDDLTFDMVFAEYNLEKTAEEVLIVAGLKGSDIDLMEIADAIYTQAINQIKYWHENIHENGPTCLDSFDARSVVNI